MNTLSRAATARFFPHYSDYSTLQRHWGVLMNSPRKHCLTAAHHALYLALCGKDWRKGFTALSNTRKLENGAFHDWELFRALRVLHLDWFEAEALAPFDGLVTPDMLRAVRAYLPAVNSYSFKPDDFSAGQFPFQAYDTEANVEV